MFALALSLLVAAPPRVAVMPLSGGVAISDRAAGSLTDALALELQKQGGMEVVLPRVTGTLLSPMKPREVVGCTTDPCLAGVAAALESERVVSGEVSWDGARLVLTLRLLDTRSARVLAMSERGFKKGTLNDLLGGLPEMVPELLRAPAPAAAKAPEVPREPPSKAEPPGTAATSNTPKAPPGSFVLHYRHAKGRYGVRLLTWETFQSGAELRQDVPANIPASAWPGRNPDGKDEFGVFWALPTAAFRNGRVNFVIEAAGGFPCVDLAPTRMDSALKWILADGLEAWMNVPECELFATREEAVRNQQRK